MHFKYIHIHTHMHAYIHNSNSSDTEESNSQADTHSAENVWTSRAVGRLTSLQQQLHAVLQELQVMRFLRVYEPYICRRMRLTATIAASCVAGVASDEWVCMRCTCLCSRSHETRARSAYYVAGIFHCNVMHVALQRDACCTATWCMLHCNVILYCTATDVSFGKYSATWCMLHCNWRLFWQVCTHIFACVCSCVCVRAKVCA